MLFLMRCYPYVEYRTLYMELQEASTFVVSILKFLGRYGPKPILELPKPKDSLIQSLAN